MHYGEIFKNEYYRATVENAKFEKIDKEWRLTARVTINNARVDGQTIDLSEIKYFIKDEKTGKNTKVKLYKMKMLKRFHLSFL